MSTHIICFCEEIRNILAVFCLTLLVAAFKKKVSFCLALCSRNVNLQSFVIIKCKTFVVTVYASTDLFYSLVYKFFNISIFSPSKSGCKFCKKNQ